MNDYTITAEDVQELMESRKMDPTLVYWPEHDEIDVIAGPLLSDISYYRYGDEVEIIATKADLSSQGDTDWDNATYDDYDAIAEMLNNNV